MVDRMINQLEREMYPQAKVQQTLQEQQIAAQFGTQALSSMRDFQENQAVLVSQTNPNKIVDAIMLTLEGKKLDHNGQIVQISDEILNRFGRGRIEFRLRSLINQSNILSHAELEEIGRVMENFANDIADELALNWKEYGITDKAMLDSVFLSITVPAFFALKRAEGQNEKNWLGKMTIENLNNAPKIQQPSKEHWWSKFKI